MADPGTVKMSLKDQIAARFKADRSEWEALVCDDKDQIGQSIDEIDQWVRRIAECMAVKNGITTIENSDQIGPDQFSRGILDDLFFPLFKIYIMLSRRMLLLCGNDYNHIIF